MHACIKNLHVEAGYLNYAVVGTMAEVGGRRPTARALVLERIPNHYQVRALI